MRREVAKKISLGILAAMVFCSVVAGVVYWQRSFFYFVLFSQSENLPVKATIRPTCTAIAKPILDADIHEFPGEVQACRRAELAFSVSGVLEEVYATQGRKFTQGQLLAKLDQRDFQHELALAKVKCHEAQQIFARAQTLRKASPGAISRNDYERLEATSLAAEVRVQVCEKKLQDSVLLAPFDGVIAKRYVENHESIQAKQPVLSLQDLSLIEIVIQVPERLLAKGGLQNFRDLAVRFNAESEHWRDVSVREYRMQSDPICRTYDVILTLPQPKDVKILPGMTATIRGNVRHQKGETGNSQSGAIVPIESVGIDNNGKNFVWIISPAGGKPQKSLIEVGQLHKDGIEVLSGIQAGQHVAVAGLHSLNEDLLVRPQRQEVEGLDL